MSGNRRLEAGDRLLIVVLDFILGQIMINLAGLPDFMCWADAVLIWTEDLSGVTCGSKCTIMSKSSIRLRPYYASTLTSVLPAHGR